MSEGFSGCSGFTFRNEQSTAFGFFHAYPGQDLDKDAFEGLNILAGGEVILIEGSNSSKKPLILKELEGELGIKHTELFQ